MIKVPLQEGKFAIIDDEFSQLISGYKWYLCKNKHGHLYAQGKSFLDKSRVLMHRIIMGCKERNQWVDHKNNNGLDNRISNLRMCTPSQNMAYRTSSKKSSSKFLGVCYHKHANKWVSHICKDGHNEYLGLFSDEKDAALAYNKMAEILHGEFAKLNVFD